MLARIAKSDDPDSEAVWSGVGSVYTVNPEIFARVLFTRICEVSWKLDPREMPKSLCRLLI